jgi:hypothetical protein
MIDLEALQRRFAPTSPPICELCERPTTWNDEDPYAGRRRFCCPHCGFASSRRYRPGEPDVLALIEEHRLLLTDVKDAYKLLTTLVGAEDDASVILSCWVDQ